MGARAPGHGSANRNPFARTAGLKDFNFTEKSYLQLRFESFNTLNHAVFATPNVSSAMASNFGYITAVAANSQPRQVQLGARIVF